MNEITESSENYERNIFEFTTIVY